MGETRQRCKPVTASDGRKRSRAVKGKQSCRQTAEPAPPPTLSYEEGSGGAKVKKGGTREREKSLPFVSNTRKKEGDTVSRTRGPKR